MDTTDDVSNEGRVTRARRKRLVSIDSEASSRPGTPEVLPKRITRRNSVTNTPQKTPSKLQDIELAETIPKRITRRNSVTNTPQKTPSKPQEIEFVEVGTSSRSRKRSVLKPQKKNVGLVKKVIRLGQDSDSDTEVINLADTTHESLVFDEKEEILELESFRNESEKTDTVTDFANDTSNIDLSKSVNPRKSLKQENPKTPNAVTDENSTVSESKIDTLHHDSAKTPKTKRSLKQDISKTPNDIVDENGTVLDTTKDSSHVDFAKSPKARRSINQVVLKSQNVPQNDEDEHIKVSDSANTDSNVDFTKSPKAKRSIDQINPKTPSVLQNAVIDENNTVSDSSNDALSVDFANSPIKKRSIEQFVVKSRSAPQNTVVDENSKVSDYANNDSHVDSTKSPKAKRSIDQVNPKTPIVLQNAVVDEDNTVSVFVNNSSNVEFAKSPKARRSINQNISKSSMNLGDSSVHENNAVIDAANESIKNGIVEKDSDFHALSTSDCSTVAAEQSKSASKSITFESDENLDESKLVFPKTPALRKKGSSLMSSKLNANKRTLQLSDSMMECEDDYDDHNEAENKSKTEMELDEESNTPKKVELEATDSRCFTPNVMQCNSTVLSNTPTPEKLLRSGKKYGDSPISEHNTSKEMEIETLDELENNKSTKKATSPTKSPKLKFLHSSYRENETTRVSTASKSPKANKSTEATAIQPELNNSKHIQLPNLKSAQLTIKNYSINNLPECDPSELTEDVEKNQPNADLNSALLSSPSKRLESKTQEQNNQKAELNKTPKDFIDMEVDISPTGTNNSKEHSAENHEKNSPFLKATSHANSWGQSIRKSSEKIDTIVMNQKSPQNSKEVSEKQNASKDSNFKSSFDYNLKLQEDSPDEDEDVDDEDENLQNCNGFFDNEAISMGPNYESGDSMDEEEKQCYAEYNVENDEGESIGSVDTSENYEDDSADEKNSFIASSDEEGEMLLEYSDDDEHLNDDNESLQEENTKKAYKRIKKFSTDTEDENALNFEVTHMIDETIPSEDQKIQDEDSCAKFSSENEGDIGKEDEIVYSENNSNEAKEMNSFNEVIVFEKNESLKDKRRSLKNSSTEYNRSNLDQEKSDKASLSEDLSTDNKDMFEKVETTDTAKESSNVSEKNISFMEAIVQGMDSPSKDDSPKKNRRSRKMSLNQTKEGQSINEETCTETNIIEKSRRSRNISLREADNCINLKIAANEDLPQSDAEQNTNDEAQDVDTAEKSFSSKKDRRYRNMSVMESSNVNEKNISFMEANIEVQGMDSPSKDDSPKKNRRSRKMSLNQTKEGQSINEETCTETKIIEKSRRSRNTSLREADNCINLKIAANEDLPQSDAEQNTNDEEQDVDTAEKSFSSKKNRRSRNMSVMENFETIMEKGQMHEDDEEFIAKENTSKYSKISQNKSQNIDRNESKKTNKNEQDSEDSEESQNEEPVKKSPKKLFKMKRQRSKSFIESVIEPKSLKECKKVKLSVSFNCPKQDRVEMNYIDSTNDNTAAHSTKKKGKLTLEEAVNERLMKIQSENTSTPFINKKGQMFNDNEKDISKILRRCNQILQNVEEGKKISKANKPTKEKKKKIKSKTEAMEVAPISSNADDVMKRAALHHAIQASQNILTKPAKKRQRERLEQQNDENKYAAKRLPPEILTTVSSTSDIDSLNKPKKRKNDHSQEEQRYTKRNVFKSMHGDLIVESEIQQPKKAKTVEVMKTSSGVVLVEPVTPLRKKNNNAGFRESPITPRATGWKMRQLLQSNTGPSHIPSPERKRKRRLAAELAIVEPTYTLPQPTWTKSAGTFKVNEQGASILSKKSHKQATNASEFGTVERAMNFRETAVYRENIPREDARNLLRRKRFFH